MTDTTDKKKYRFDGYEDKCQNKKINNERVNCILVSALCVRERPIKMKEQWKRKREGGRLATREGAQLTKCALNYNVFGSYSTRGCGKNAHKVYRSTYERGLKFKSILSQTVWVSTFDLLLNQIESRIIEWNEKFKKQSKQTVSTLTNHHRFNNTYCNYMVKSLEMHVLSK